MAEKKRTGLKDVARVANVSVTTISRLLNGSLELPEETRARIDQAIRELDYKPNPHARRLSTGRSDAIGLVVPDIANPFFGTLVASVEEEADRRGLAVSLYATLNRPGREAAYLDLISRNHVDGLIFITNHPDDGALADHINRSGRVVVLDEDVPLARAPKLFCDNEQGGALAGEHVACFGHSNVLFIGGPETMLSARRRLAGVKRGVSAIFGEHANIMHYEADYTVEAGRQAALRFLEAGRPASAIIASSDELAIGLVEIFQSKKIRVPEDVSIVGFDDIAPLHLFAPALTAIRQPVRALGHRAVALLLETNWQERGDEPFPEEVLPVEIQVRNSVAPHGR